jgi:hypothetical protein
MDYPLFLIKKMRMTFEKYKDLSGGAGITGYRFLDKGIILQFKYKDLYLYDDIRPGEHHVQQMKILAKKGKELTTYVNKYIRDNYREKLN